MAIVLYDLAGRDDCRFSPYCWRAKMALLHKGLAFETQPVPFTGIPGVAGGRHKTVPILDDGGKIVGDSFAIAEYLESAYPGRPTLFGGQGGRAAARFVEQWANMAINAAILPMIVADIHARLRPEDADYFRDSREARLGRKLEEAQAGRDDRVEAVRAALAPVRRTLELQFFLGGDTPLFHDYLLFGTLQWARVAGEVALLEPDDPVAAWFETCLDLFDGYARNMPAARTAA